MPQSTFTFRVDSQLKDVFTDFAQKQDRSAAQLLRDFMRRTIIEAQHEEPSSKESWDAWFSAKVEAGQQDFATGNFISQDEAEQRAQNRREELMKAHLKQGKI